LQTAWDKLKVFYRKASDRPPKPSRIELGRVTAEYAALYARKEDLPEETIPVLVAPVDIPDNPPTNEEITFAVRGLRNRRAPGPSGMSAEHLKAWLELSSSGQHSVGGAMHLCPACLCHWRNASPTIMGNHDTAPKAGGTVQRHWPLGNLMEADFEDH
jgi:hypothetical protein